MCGLKHITSSVLDYAKVVTSFVGVWIETCYADENDKKTLVTSFVGVWIETEKKKKSVDDSRVTSFVGVWIETVSLSILVRIFLSHPSWVCGLKPDRI